MMIGKRYKDSMDPSRVVVPMDEKGNCRVYFDGNFNGKARVAPALFDLDQGSDRWPGPGARFGFNAEGAEREVEETEYEDDDAE